MDREVLKRTLRQQAVPMEQAVRKKLAYLSGKDVFSDDDCMHGDYFTELLKAGTVEEENVDKIIEPSTTEAKIAVHKKSLAEKINALRGVTAMPGGYIHNWR